MNNGEYLKKMGAKLRAAREAIGLYLRDLGKLSNIHFSAIYEIEHGKRNAHILTLKAIAYVLKIDVKDFI